MTATPRQLRCLDRMMDLYLINTVGGLLLRRIGVRTPDPMQDEKDRSWLNISYGWLDGQLAAGNTPVATFSIADCGAAAALFYAPEVASFDGFGNLKAYAKRLAERDSVRGIYMPRWRRSGTRSSSALAADSARLSRANRSAGRSVDQEVFDRRHRVPSSLAASSGRGSR